MAVWSKVNAGKPAETSLGEFGLACNTPITLPDAVTAVAFAPKAQTDGSYVIVAGLESGQLVLLSWLPNVSATDEWKVLKTLDCSSAHHKSVRRIRFSPSTSSSGDSNLFATCSSDHAVKLFSLKWPQS